MAASGNFSEIEVCPSMTYVVCEPTAVYIRSSMAACVINALFAITGFFLNVKVVHVFWKSKTLTNKVAYFLIMLLTVTDLFASIIVHPLYIINSVSEIRGTANCVKKLLYQVAQLLLSGQSAMTLFILNIERYLSILHPVFHRNRVTKRRCLAALLFLDLIPFAFAFSRFFDSNIQSFVTAMIVIICLASSYIYIAIYYSVTRKTCILRNNERNHRNVSVKEVRLAKTCFCIVACCFLFYLPQGIMLAIHTEQTKTLDLVVHIKVWTTSLVTINSTVNCLIFVWANREFRQVWRREKQGTQLETDQV